jgi:hypothetical protein
MGDGSESPHHPAEFPAEFAAYAAQKMNPLHRQLIVENAAPGSIDGRLLLDDLAREFSNAESIDAFMKAGQSSHLQVFCMENSLSPASCAALRKVVDTDALSTVPDSVDSLPEHQKLLPATEAREMLEELIGAREAQKLFRLPQDFHRAETLHRQREEKETGTTSDDDDEAMRWPPVFSLKEAFIRRYSSDSRPFNPFHQDKSHLTVNVALSSSEDHRGGRLLVVLNSEVQALDRAEGEATLHGSDLIHGVSAMTSGVRYSLLLFFSKRQRPVPTKP